MVKTKKSSLDSRSKFINRKQRYQIYRCAQDKRAKYASRGDNMILHQTRGMQLISSGGHKYCISEQFNKCIYRNAIVTMH